MNTNPKGKNVVRRIVTEDDNRAPWWPEVLAYGTTINDTGYGEYAKLLMGFLGFAGQKVIGLMAEGKNPGDVPLHEWNMGLWLHLHKDAGQVPQCPGAQSRPHKATHASDQTEDQFTATQAWTTNSPGHQGKRHGRDENGCHEYAARGFRLNRG